MRKNPMRLGVIICPQCHFAKGVDLCSKTTRCTHCGKTLHIKKLKVFYDTTSQEHLRRAIGLLNAEVDNNDASFKKKLYDNRTSK